jgi:hypothetical protein
MSIQKNFVVKNGIEVNTDLIFADTNSKRVGIVTTNPEYTLDVRGGIGATDVLVSGSSTVNDLTINGILNLGNTVSSPGQYLIATETGVSWASPLQARTVDVRVANSGDTIFNTTYSVGLLDVFINGVKISNQEFVADSGATVILNTPCFGGEIIEFIAYNATVAAGSTGISGITILNDGIQVSGSLQVNSIDFVGADVDAVGAGYGVTVYFPNYVDTSGISSYSDFSGISTDVIGGIASVTSVDAETINTDIIIASDGFISIGNTTPIQILLEGDQLIFNAIGIGSTAFTLS